MTLANNLAFLSPPEVIATPGSDSILLLSDFDLNAFDMGLYESHQIDHPQSLSKAVEKRQAEYLAGRLLAQDAFERLGKPAAQIPIGKDRAPQWPQGLSGSISHTQGQVACLMTTRAAHFAGIDIERDLTENSLKSVKKVTLQPRELEFLAHQTVLPEAQLAGAIFSAKETLFKALYPIVQRFFGFDAAVLVALTDSALRLELTEGLHASLPAGRCFDVKMLLRRGYVLTWIIHQAD